MHGFLYTHVIANKVKLDSAQGFEVKEYLIVYDFYDHKRYIYPWGEDECDIISAEFYDFKHMFKDHNNVKVNFLHKYRW